VVFISHMDYLDEGYQGAFIDDIRSARANMNKHFSILVAKGPTVDDVKKEEDVYAEE